MLIKLNVGMSGPEVGSHAAGEIVDWPDFDAPNLIAAGYADPVEARKVETATVGEKREVAVTRKRKA